MRKRGIFFGYIVLLVFVLVAFGRAQSGVPTMGSTWIGTASLPATTLDASCHGAATSTPASCNLPSAMTVTAGDDIACTSAHFSFGTNVVEAVVSDSVNGVYRAVYQGEFNSDTAHWLGGWIFHNSAGGTITPTATTCCSTAGIDLVCAAYKGTATSNALDPGAVSQFNPTNGVGVTSTNPNNGTTHTPTNAKEVIYCGMGNIGPTTPTAGTNYTLLTGATQSIALWPEYWIQTTATTTNCPYTAASDTWLDGGFGIMNAGAASGGVTPMTGFFSNFAGQTATTAVSGANWTASSYESVNFDSWVASNITTMKYETPASLPNLVTQPYVNGALRSVSTAVSVLKTSTVQNEGMSVNGRVPVGITNYGESDVMLAQTGTYAFTTGGTICDADKFAPTGGGGDTLTKQYLDEGSGNLGFDMEVSGLVTLRSQGIQVPSATAWYMLQVLNDASMHTWALTAVANASGGNTVYTCSSGCNTLFTGQVVSVGQLNYVNQTSSGTATITNGFSTTANNGIFTVVGTPSSTSVTLNNPSGAAQTAGATLYTTHRMVVTQVTPGTPSTLTVIGTDYIANSGQTAPTFPSSTWNVSIGSGGSCGTTGMVQHFAYPKSIHSLNLADFPSPI